MTRPQPLHLQREWLASHYLCAVLTLPLALVDNNYLPCTMVVIAVTLISADD